LVVATGEPLLRDGHTDAGGNALAKWASRGLDARHPVVLRVTRCLAIELAEPANVVERYRGVPQPFVVSVHGSRAGKMECRPDEHGSMAVRENEAIQIVPDRILQIKPQDPIPDRIDQWRQCHRSAWVSGLGLLHCVD